MLRNSYEMIGILLDSLGSSARPELLASSRRSQPAWPGQFLASRRSSPAGELANKLVS